MKYVTAVIITIFIALSVLWSIGLQYQVHQLIFQTFLPADDLASERQDLLTYFRGQSALDSAKFQLDELSHIEDIRQVLGQGELIFFYVAILFIVWQFVVLRRFGQEEAVIMWRKQIKIGLLLWPVLSAIIGLAFMPLFILFHQIVFPDGNWLFDPATDLIIQLYPPQFFFYFFIVWAILTELVILAFFFLIPKKRTKPQA